MGLGDGEQIWRRAKRLCRSLLTPRFRQEAVREHQLSKHLWLIICDHQRSLQSICPSNTAFHQRISSREFPIPIKVGKRRVWRLCPQLCRSAKFHECPDLVKADLRAQFLGITITNDRLSLHCRHLSKMVGCLQRAQSRRSSSHLAPHSSEFAAGARMGPCCALHARQGAVPSGQSLRLKRSSRLGQWADIP